MGAVGQYHDVTPIVLTTRTGALLRSSTGKLHVRLDNWTATTAPGTGDDTGDGYEVGSQWLNTNTGTVYTCTSAALGAATWSSGGGASALNDLTDVDTTGQTTGTLLRYSGSAWVPYADSNYATSGHNHSGTYEPVITAGTTGQYWRGDKTWQTLTTHDAVTLNASVADILGLSTQELTADDAGADKLVFWDESAGKLTYLTIGTGLSVSDTTITAAGGAGGTPGGSDTQVQFNDGGAFGGDSYLTWNKTTNTLLSGTTTLSLATDSITASGARAIYAGLAGLFTNQLSVLDTTAMASGVGGVINFMGAYSTTANPPYTWLASIAGVKANATDNNYDGNIVIYTRKTGAGQNEVARFDADGRFGLGVIPTSQLHIAKSSTTFIDVLVHNTSTSTNDECQSRIFLRTGTQTVGVSYGMTAVGSTYNGNAYFWNGENTAFMFATNNLERMRLLADGKFGIGTTAPDKQCEINSATGACLRLTYNDSNGSAANYTDFTVSSGGDLTITPSGGDVTIAGNLTLSAYNLITDTTTGMKIGTAATQKLGFYGATPVVQKAKASYNNWAALGDVVNALVSLGLFDAA